MYKGDLSFFGEFSAADRETNPIVKEQIGYTGTSNYYLPHWTIKQIEEINQILFQRFNSDRFRTLCDKLSWIVEWKMEYVSLAIGLVLAIILSVCSHLYMMKLIYAGKYDERRV